MPRNFPSSASSAVQVQSFVGAERFVHIVGFVRGKICKGEFGGELCRDEVRRLLTLVYSPSANQDAEHNTAGEKRIKKTRETNLPNSEAAKVIRYSESLFFKNTLYSAPWVTLMAVAPTR